MRRLRRLVHHGRHRLGRVAAVERRLYPDALRERYVNAEEAERLAILHEFLRLEPVVSNLRRRTTAPVELPGEDGADPHLWLSPMRCIGIFIVRAKPLTAMSLTSFAACQ